MIWRARLPIFPFLNILVAITICFCITAITQNDSAGQPRTSKSSDDQTESVLLQQLTDEEEEWLQSHPNIVLGYTGDLEPDVIVNSDGTFSGMVVDILDALNEKFGTNISLEIYPIPELLENAKKNKIDGILNIHPDYSQSIGLLSTQVYWPAYMTVFARKGVLFDGPVYFSGKRVAVIDGVYFTKKYMEEYGKQATIVKVKDALTGLRSVDNGGVDYFLGTSYNAYYISKYQLFNVFTAYMFWDVPEMFGIGVRSDWPQLVSILNKWISNFSKEEIHAIVAKWSNLPTKQVTIELTSEEKTWLKAHPIITLGGGNFPPLEFFNETKGQPDGVGPDYARLIGSMLGVEFRLVSGDWQETLDMAKSKEIDGIRLIFKSKEREKYLNYTQPYMRLGHSIVVRKSTEGVSSLKDLSHKQVATLRGIYAYHYMKEHYPDIDIVDYPTWEDVLRTLANGDIEAAVGTLPAITYMINTLFITNLKVTALPPEMDRDVYLGIRPDWPELTVIVNKAIDAITEKQHSDIKQKWVALNMEDKKRKISLTPEEKAWISKSHPIRVRVTDSPPYLYSENGQAVGITVDFLKTVSERTRIKFHFVIPSPPFAEDIKGLIQHTGPDIIATLMPNQEREKNILFTDVYISSPWFIFTRDNSPFVASMNNLNGRTVAVVKDYLVHIDTVKNYPEIDLLICKNNKEALSAVSSGKAFAFIGDLMSTPDMINRFGLNNLKAVSPAFLQEHKTAMGVRSDWPELRDIINKVLDSMPAAQKTSIINKWSSVKFDYGISPHDVAKWVLIFGSITALILFLIVFWNRSLNLQVIERTAEVLKNENRFQATFEQAAVGIAHVSPEGRFLRVNQKFADIVGYKCEEIMVLTFIDITYAEDIDIDVQQVEKLLRGDGDTYSLEKRYVHKNGNLIWINLTVSLLRENTGKPKWFVSVVEDIGIRKEAEEELRVSEEKFYKVFQASPACITIVNLATGRCIEANQAFEKTLGYSREEIVGEGLLDVDLWKNPEDRARLMPLYLKQRYLKVPELELRKKSGESIVVEVHFVLMRLSGEDVSFAAFIDITKRKQAEGRLHDYQQRLKALAFELTVAEERERHRIAIELHDNVSQSLVFARVRLETAMKSVSEEKLRNTLKEVSESILQTAKETRHLIFDLSSPLMNELGLSSAIAEWMEEEIKKRHGLETNFIDTRGVGYKKTLDDNVRAVLFRNVREALTNAVKYAHATKVLVRLSNVGENLEISVQDNGVGFDPSKISQNSIEEGGFGLFSIQERMTDMGGALEILSEPDKGCKIVLTIPLTPNEKTKMTRPV